MKRKLFRDTVTVRAKVAPVPWFELSRPIYKALGKFYKEHEKGKLLDHGILQDAWTFATACEDVPKLRRDMKLAPEEEREYAIGLLQLSKRQGFPKGADEVFNMLRADRRLNADVQVLIDLVEQVLEKAGSRVDWDKHPELGDDDREHCGDDTTDVPDA